MAMTVKQLAEALMEDPRTTGDEIVHIVFHGYERLSFNLPVTEARRGANGNDFIIMCEEPREV